MTVYLSELAETKLKNITEYLRETRGSKIKRDFLNKLSAKIHQISLHPESCPKSDVFPGIYKSVVSRQTTLYYRIIELKIRKLKLSLFLIQDSTLIRYTKN